MNKLVQAVKALFTFTPGFAMAEAVRYFSLNHAMLYVGYLEDRDGNRARGVTIEFPSFGSTNPGPYGTCNYVFSADDGLRLVRFLDQLLAHDFPAEYRFKGDMGSGWFTYGDCHWVVRKYVPEWHGGGGYRGRMDNTFGYLITDSSARALRQTLIDFFELDEAASKSDAEFPV